MVKGTPAECVYWTIQEMLCVVEIPNHIISLADSSDDAEAVLVSYMNSTHAADIWEQSRFVRENWDTVDVIPEDWYGGMSEERMAQRHDLWDRQRTSCWHYYWAFGLFN